MTSPPPSSHLVTVWNPSYATNALQEHVAVLLDWARRPGGDPQDVFVWWGKVKSAQRQAPMPHKHDVLAISPAEHDAREVHLYLTDYRSLYVAQVDCIEAADPRGTDPEHVPAYYTEQELECDCWFMLCDIRLLVRDDLESVAAELMKLRNTRYGDRRVSLYGGMVDLPLIVTRDAPCDFFSDAEKALLTDGQPWAVFDAAQSGVGATEATLRLDHFGDSWSLLEGPARRFVTTGESIMRHLRSDPAADLSPVAVSYGKALEVQLTALLRTAMHDAPEHTRFMNVDGRTVRLPDALPLNLSRLVSALADDRERASHLCRVLRDGRWLVEEFAAAVDRFTNQARNPGAHGDTTVRESIARDVVVHWRNRMLGVGCEGLLQRLARVQRK
ncbi:MAG TPA: hypothetical protein VE861_09930 [Gemmatimonadaceae bacterium]|nr:hypothetical protein [Gemmatimonadaceae bacterium]